MKKSLKHKLFNRYTIIGAVIILAVIVYLLTRHSSAPSFQYTQAAIGDVVETVSVTGQVLPVDKAALSFQKSGVISSVPVSVGQAVKKGDLIASLDSASDEAALASAQADLAELSRGLRPQEYAADQAAVASASTTQANAEKDAVNAVHAGYVQAADAVNAIDAFFTNPQTGNPVINIYVQTTPLQQQIDNERLGVTGALNQWQTTATQATSATSAKALSAAEGYAATIKSFLTDLSAIVNNLNVGNSGQSQASIDNDIAAMNTAMSTLNQAISTVSSADTALQSASSGYAQSQSNFTLQQAGSSPDSIAAQAAKVAQAQAVVDNDRIVSPIDGIVTQADPSVGEFAAAGQGGFAVQSNGTYKIEAYVAEADIAKVALGDLASTTLDAYGSNVDFPAQVAAVDPAETVLEGVPTYKVTLYFVTADPRIRSGMTANLEILTHEARNVLEIPYRAVTITATSSTVRLVSSDGKTYSSAPVVTGLKGSDGTIQIISGLNEGDKVVTYVK